MDGSCAIDGCARNGETGRGKRRDCTNFSATPTHLRRCCFLETGTITSRTRCFFDEPCPTDTWGRLPVIVLSKDNSE